VRPSLISRQGMMREVSKEVEIEEVEIEEVKIED
jgi:hypothetical protein